MPPFRRAKARVLIKSLSVIKIHSSLIVNILFIWWRDYGLYNCGVLAHSAEATLVCLHLCASKGLWRGVETLLPRLFMWHGDPEPSLWRWEVREDIHLWPLKETLHWPIKKSKILPCKPMTIILILAFQLWPFSTLLSVAYDDGSASWSASRPEGYRIRPCCEVWMEPSTSLKVSKGTFCV